MREDLKILKEEFKKKEFRVVRVSSEGFEFDGNVVPSIRGNIFGWNIIRKRFSDKKLLCYSRDGHNNSNGKSCEDCEHPECKPGIRLEIKGEKEYFLVALNYTSSMNFIDFFDSMDYAFYEVPEMTVILRVIKRGKWGEVTFNPDPDSLDF